MFIQSISNYLSSKSYNINISKNSIYINNYNKIEHISETLIKINIDDFKVIIKGNNFKISKMIDKEILFNGQIESFEIKND